LVSDIRESHRLRVFKNRVLWNLFGPKTEEVTGDGRKLDNEELYGLCSAANVIQVSKSRRIKWVELMAQTREKKNAYRVCVGKLEGKRPLVTIFASS
jgi:hypothetical protein